MTATPVSSTQNAFGYILSHTRNFVVAITHNTYILLKKEKTVKILLRAQS